MYLRSLYLKNFRAYSEEHISFSPGVNLILGPNASGKTTLLEAIYLLMSGRSFRTTQTKELIREGADSFYVEATFVKHDVEQTLKVSYSVKERRITYNQTVLPSISGLYGLLQGTILTPDDAGLIKGQPRVRRAFLDMQLAQADPLYVHHLSRYHRAMRQRNHLLRAKSIHTIEPWEKEMVKGAIYLVNQRSQAVADLCEIGRHYYASLTDHSESFGLSYQTSLKKNLDELSSWYQEQLQRLRSKELLFGSTLTGPHRDDLVICLQDKEARHYASEGQQRSCTVALRLAEWELLKRRSEAAPLMLMDDLGISLDASRRERLYSLIRRLKQVFITTTDDLPEIEGSLKIEVGRQKPE